MSSNNCNSRNLLRYVYGCGCGCGWNSGPFPGNDVRAERVAPAGCCEWNDADAANDNDCERRRRHCHRPRPMRGAFVSPMPLSVAAGANIPLICCGPSCGINAVGGAIEFEQAGVYYATYALTMPAGETLTTTLTPTLNGAILPAGMLEMEATAERAVPAGPAAQVIFYAEAGDRFALTTSEAISLPAAGTPLLSVDSMRIDD